MSFIFYEGDLIQTAPLISAEERHVLNHSLGLTRGPEVYRNHYATDPSTPNGVVCEKLVKRGMMVDRGEQQFMGGMHLYQVTKLGQDMVTHAS